MPRYSYAICLYEMLTGAPAAPYPEHGVARDHQNHTKCFHFSHNRSHIGIFPTLRTCTRHYNIVMTAGYLELMLHERLVLKLCPDP